MVMVSFKLIETKSLKVIFKLPKYKVWENITQIPLFTKGNGWTTNLMVMVGLWIKDFQCMKDSLKRDLDKALGSKYTKTLRCILENSKKTWKMD